MSLLAKLADTLVGSTGLSDHFGITRKSLYHRVSRGQVPPPIRIGALLRWRPDDILRWEEEQQQVEMKLREEQQPRLSLLPRKGSTKKASS